MGRLITLAPMALLVPLVLAGCASPQAYRFEVLKSGAIVGMGSVSAADVSTTRIVDASDPEQCSIAVTLGPPLEDGDTRAALRACSAICKSSMAVGEWASATIDKDGRFSFACGRRYTVRGQLR